MHWNVLVMDICIVRIKLKQISITSKQMLYRGFLTGSKDRFVLKFQVVAVNQS